MAYRGPYTIHATHEVMGSIFEMYLAPYAVRLLLSQFKLKVMKASVSASLLPVEKRFVNPKAVLLKSKLKALTKGVCVWIFPKEGAFVTLWAVILKIKRPSIDQESTASGTAGQLEKALSRFSFCVSRETVDYSVLCSLKMYLNIVAS